MQRLCLSGLAWVLVFMPAFAGAQSPVLDLNGGGPLGLEDARREALTRDPMLAGLKAELEASRQRVAQARFLDPPMLEGQIWQWPINTFDPSRVDMYMVSIAQEFPGRGKRASQGAVMETDVAQLQSQQEAREREIDAAVRSSYVELATARRTIEIYRATLPVMRQAIAASQARYESGGVSQVDVLEGVLSLSKLQDELIGLDESAALAAVRLNTLMQRDPDASIGQLDAVSEPAQLLPLPELQQLALQKHPDLEAARALQSRAGAMQTEALADLKPDVRVSGGYMFRPREGDAWMASVGLTWPKAPWARGKNDARVAEAKAEATAAESKVTVTETMIRQQIRENYLKAVAAEQRLELLRSTILPQSRQAIAIASAAYQTDKVDVQRVLAQQRMLLDGQLSYSRAIGDAAQAISELERLVGSTVTAPSDVVSTGGAR